MENKLRNKFVVVTMSLICLLFSVLYIINYFYQEYLFDNETRGIVQWIAQNDILIDKNGNRINKDISTDDLASNPVIAVIVNNDTDNPEIEFVYNADERLLQEGILTKIIEKDKNEWKSGDYIYHIRRLADGRYYIVLMDTKDDPDLLVRYMYPVIMIVLGICALAFITMLLSGFVTRPAKDAFKREQQFISDASHELKTPLGAISMNAQAIRLKYKDDKNLDNIISEAKRMDRLIEQLLILSGLDEKTEISKKGFSLSSCIEEMALTYESLAFEKNIEYFYNIDGSINCYANEDDIRQLTALLIDNAIKHSEAGDRIDIFLGYHSGNVRLEVENTGKGIDPKDIDHIFERFYKADTSRSSSSFGLGLSIAKAIADRYGYKISVHSEPGVSTCFTVIFIS